MRISGNKTAGIGMHFGEIYDIIAAVKKWKPIMFEDKK